MVVSASYIKYLNNKYEKIYLNNEEKIVGTGIIVSYEEREYGDLYIANIREISGTKIYNLKITLYIQDKSVKFKYGDLVSFKGEYQKPEIQRNYMGFDYSDYLKSIKVVGTVKVENINRISSNKQNFIMTYANNVKQSIILKINSMEYIQQKGLLKGILLGDTTDISDEIDANFKASSLSHILAISGDHISYLILGVTFILNMIKFRKKKVYSLTILFLIFFIFVVGFSPSVVRACIMGSVLIGAKIFYRKQDFWTSIAFSLLIILIYNPYSIFNIGLILSYGGTVGIVIFSKNIIKCIKGHIKDDNQIIKAIYTSFAISLAVQIVLMPIMMLSFNVISFTFFVSNIIVIPIIAGIILLGFLMVIVSYFLPWVSIQISIILNLLLGALVNLAKLSSKLPCSNLIVATPNMHMVLAYYVLILIFNMYVFLKNKPINRVRKIEKTHLIILIKMNKKAILIITIIVLCSNVLVQKIPKNTLDIYFIDVGQRRLNINYYK